jgi:hypothetical protein
VRISPTGINKFLTKEIDASEFAKTYFTLDKPDQSVYRANSLEEENEIAAAHYLTLNRDSIDSVVVMRFCPEKANACGVSVSGVLEVPGTTGFEPVDARHFDLLGDAASLIALMGELVESFRAGRESVRGISKITLKYYIELMSTHAKLSSKAKKTCKRLIEKG